MDYVADVDALLEALLSREVRGDDEKYCRHCNKGGILAVWRCKDCSMGLPMCRGCMRSYHLETPFHRIERWNGTFYRPAELWEVGIYLLIRHHIGIPICDSLESRRHFLERVERENDDAEQARLLATPALEDISLTETSATSHENEDIEMADSEGLQDTRGDQEFISFLQELREKVEDGRDIGEDDDEIDDDAEDEEIEIRVPNHYLPEEKPPDNLNGGEYGVPQHIVGTYVRVVHTNGIHNIAMISCDCRGHDVLPRDLLACRLLPASFARIQTLFSAQLLDHFRLCNLELKASAYHFYKLLQRLTNPMAPAEVVDLYKEFRRMSRIWRWMKRLKWAGFGNNTKKCSEVKPGELTVFCPTCPQPGINLPDNWKDDPARSALFLSHHGPFLISVVDGYSKDPLWRMVTSRLITFVKRRTVAMYGLPKVEE